MPISKFLTGTFLFLSLGLSACNLPAPQAGKDSEDTQAATFFISDVSGDTVVTKLKTEYAIPDSKTFKFSVCLKSQARKDLLVAHRFLVKEINKVIKTNDSGCLIWNEEVPFNYFAEPTYLTWKREIVAKGVHKGSRTAKFAINPWKDEGEKSPAVMDLVEETPEKLISNPEEVAAALKGGATLSSGAKNALWVNDMRLQSNEQKFTTDGVVMQLQLVAVPQLQVITMSGEKVLRPINQGQFKAQISLIHSIVEDNKEIHRLLSESVPQVVAVRNGTLFISAPLKLTSIPTRGQLILGLDITSESQKENIGNFQGVYLIGDYDQIKTNAFLRLMSEVTKSPGFKLESFVNARLEGQQPATGAVMKPAKPDAYVKPRIEVQPLEINFMRIGKETTSERQVIYNIRACFKNGLEQKITRGFSFDVKGFRSTEYSSGFSGQIQSDNNGCITWDESVSFKFYECHRSLKGSVEITNKDLVVQQKIDIVINPWDTFGKFGRDLRFPYNQDFVITDCKKENVLPSTLTLRNFSYSTLAYKYEIDSLMNLSVKKKIRFKVDAAVSVYSDMGLGRMEAAQKIRPGIYLLKLALIKNRDYYNQKTYVTSVEKLVSTLDGDVKADLELKMADLKALGNRNTLLVELDPVLESKVTVGQDGEIHPKEKTASLDDLVDKASGLRGRTFNGPMVLNLDRDSQELTVLDLKEANAYLAQDKLPATTAHKSVIREYIRWGQQLQKEAWQSQVAQSDLDLFANKNNLKKVSVNNLATAQDLHQVLGQSPMKMTDAKIREELQRFATTGKISKDLTTGLCAYWFRSYLKKDLWDDYAMHNATNCVLRGGSPERLFTIEKRLFVKEVGGFQKLKGFNAGIAVGNNITLTKSQAKSDYKTKSLTFSTGLTKKFAEVFSIGVSASYAISQSLADAESTANSTSVTTNISPVMQQNIYQLKLNRYQECSIVRLKPSLFMKKGLFESALNPAYNEQQMVDAASKGLMICTGQENTTPIVRQESYYLIAQETNSAQMQDSADETNRNFFIALRGEKEFERLMYFMKGTLKTPGTADRETNDHAATVRNLDTLFNTGTTNIPGAYTDTPAQ